MTLSRRSSHAYRIKLPLALKSLHEVFHVSLLKLDIPDQFPKRKPLPPPTVKIEGDKHYDVKAIIDSKKIGRGTQFLVRWKGYGPKDDTCEPYHNLIGAHEEMEMYWIRHPTKTQLTEEQMADLLQETQDQNEWFPELQ